MTCNDCENKAEYRVECEIKNVLHYTHKEIYCYVCATRFLRESSILDYDKIHLERL